MQRPILLKAEKIETETQKSYLFYILSNKVVQCVQILLYPFVVLLLKLIFNHKVEGRENLKGLENKALIFASNHSHWLDGIIGGYSLSFSFAPFLPIRFIVAKEFFRFFKNNPLAKFPLSIFVALYVRLNGSLPIDREERESLEEKLKDAVYHLNNNGKLWIFPEGKITKTGELQKFKKGVAYLHQKTKAPIIPVAIINSYKITSSNNLLQHILRKKPLIVRFGKPIYDLSNFTLEEGANIVREKVQELMKDRKIESHE